MKVQRAIFPESQELTIHEVVMEYPEILNG
jgi:hypothetical protein